MKLTAAVVAVAVLATQAAAVPSPEAVAEAAPRYHGGFCGLPGSPCLKVKRAAHAVADALAEAKAAAHHHHFDFFCGLPGSPCLKARDSIDTIAARAQDGYTQVFVREAEAEADAEAKKHHYSKWEFFCGLPGSPCLKARDALPEARYHGGFCGLPGSPCLKTRDAAADAKHKLDFFCGLPGSPCLKNRDASPDAKKHHHHFDFFCGLPGSPCLKTRAASPEARYHGGFCGLPGSPCLKARDALPDARYHGGFCGLPGSPCLKARDAKSIGEIIQKGDPAFLRGECFREGSECHTLLKIHKAIQEVKRDAKAVENLTGDEKLAHCHDKGADCDYLAKSHAMAQKYKPEEAEKEEKECWGPEGACTIAERDFDELDSAVGNAVASLNEE